MSWTVGQIESGEGTVVVVRKARSNKLLQRLLGPELSEEVGRVKNDREGSANRNRSFHDQMEIVLERAHQVAAVKNNWHK